LFVDFPNCWLSSNKFSLWFLFPYNRWRFLGRSPTGTKELVLLLLLIKLVSSIKLIFEQTLSIFSHNLLVTKLLFHWFVFVVQDPNTRYPVVVRFQKVNYANVSTNNYALDEVEEVKEWDQFNCNSNSCHAIEVTSLRFFFSCHHKKFVSYSLCYLCTSSSLETTFNVQLLIILMFSCFWFY
jgi:hypothetical protein